MANFKVVDLEAKLGITVELQGRWVRVDRGMSLKNVSPDEEVMLSEIRGAFDKAQKLLEEEVLSATKSAKSKA